MNFHGNCLNFIETAIHQKTFKGVYIHHDPINTQ